MRNAKGKSGTDGNLEKLLKGNNVGENTTESQELTYGLEERGGTSKGIQRPEN